MAETDEAVVVTVAAGIGYAIGAPNTATVTIEDNETPMIAVTATDAAVSEPGTDTGVFTFRRLGNKNTALTVNFKASGDRD